MEHPHPIAYGTQIMSRVPEHIVAMGRICVTEDEDGRCVAVTRQDEEHRILSVIWEYTPKIDVPTLADAA